MLVYNLIFKDEIEICRERIQRYVTLNILSRLIFKIFEITQSSIFWKILILIFPTIDFEHGVVHIEYDGRKFYRV